MYEPLSPASKVIAITVHIDSSYNTIIRRYENNADYSNKRFLLENDYSTM